MSLLFVLMLSWSVELRTSGGYSGHGTGNISVSSDGQVGGIWPCGGTLAAERLQSVESAVSAARPEAWLPRYQNETIVYDEVRYRVSLTMDGQRYDTAWRGATREMLPDDLAALHRALWAARVEHVERCEKRPPRIVEVERYRLQSNPWVNLHQRLIHDAQFKTAFPAALTVEQGAIWREAVATYRTLFGDRSPVFDPELVAINTALAKTFVVLLPDAVPQRVADTLRLAMTVYQTTQWPEDDLLNRKWIADAQPLLDSAAAELAAAHSKAYGSFPKRILVDVSAFAGRFGAYTVGDADSVHVVISSTDPGKQGLTALEMLMHEPSHGVADESDDAIGSDLTRAAEELRLRPPHNLWHALLFYTSGELTRQALARRDVEYEPYMYRAGMFNRQFRGFQQSIETHWRAYLAGEKSRQEAIRQIVLETAKAED